MIDHAQREQLALRLRRLASGRLPAPEFEDVYYDLKAAHSKDPALQAVSYFGWTLFGDGDDRLTGRRTISRDSRRIVARCVLYMRTAHEYSWPAHPPVFTWRDLVTVMTYGLIQWEHPAWARWRRTIDFSVWPFANAAEATAASRSWPFLSRANARLANER